VREKGWEWRLSKFPLSAYCCISGHEDLVFINQPKALVASKVYHTVKYSCEMDGWTTEKERRVAQWRGRNRAGARCGYFRSMGLSL